MADLFPIASYQGGNATLTSSSAGQPVFGSSWRFDFARGEFVLSPSGRVSVVTGEDAWLEWCRKAIRTARYRYLAYSRYYGQEFDDLIARHLSREANESEIRRMVTECLSADPRTSSVDGFDFSWESDRCFFSCTATSSRGSTTTLNGSVVNGS